MSRTTILSTVASENNATFHYDAKLALRAAEQISNKLPDHVSMYSLGHDPLDWYFEVGDLRQSIL